MSFVDRLTLQRQRRVSPDTPSPADTAARRTDAHIIDRIRNRCDGRHQRVLAGDRLSALSNVEPSVSQCVRQ